MPRLGAEMARAKAASRAVPSLNFLMVDPFVGLDERQPGRAEAVDSPIPSGALASPFSTSSPSAGTWLHEESHA